MYSKYITAHIGGFGGTIEFPKNTEFNDDINFLIFEALENAVDTIKEKNRTSLTFPYCVGKDENEVDFYVTKDEYKSSFYKPREDRELYLPFTEKLHVNLINSLKIKKKIKLKTYSLDYLAENKTIPEINFLAMDTKGSELDILKGSENLLKKSIVGIKTELYFDEIYENTPSVDENHNYLKERNFILCEINPLDRTFRMNLSEKFLGRGQPIHCDAIYILNPNKVDINKFNSKEDYINKMQKIAFTSIVYGFTDLGFLALDLIYQKNLDLNESGKINKFLKDFYIIMKKNQNQAPDIWDPSNNDYNKHAIETTHETFLDKSYFEKNIFEKTIYRIKHKPLSIIRVINNLFKNKILFFFSLFKNFEIERNNNFQIFLEKHKLFLAAFRVSNTIRNEYKRSRFKKK